MRAIITLSKEKAEGIIKVHAQEQSSGRTYVDLWVSAKLRKNTTCVFCDDPMCVGDEAFRPITNGYNRMWRGHRVCVGASPKGVRERALLEREILTSLRDTGRPWTGCVAGSGRGVEALRRLISDRKVTETDVGYMLTAKGQRAAHHASDGTGKCRLCGRVVKLSPPKLRWPCPCGCGNDIRGRRS